MDCNFLFKILHTIRLEEIFNKHWSKSRLPISGGLELTYKCNLSCVHCYATAGRGSRDLTFEEIKSVVDQLVNEGLLFLYITGGEVLVRKDFNEIYKYIKGKGVIVEVFTNATLIDDDTIELFLEYPPFNVDITIYGINKETYEKTTGVKGSFNKFISGIEKLKKNNIPFTLKAVVLKTNLEELFDMKKFSRDLGVKFRYSCNISPMINGDKSTTEYRITPEEAFRFDLEDEGRNLFWSSISSKEYNIENYRAGDYYRIFMCKAGINSFHIDAEGKLHACVKERCHGYDLLSGSFKEGWYEHIVSAIGKKYASEKYPCLKCTRLKFCDHCPADFELENGDPEIPTSFRCDLAKMREMAFGQSKCK